MSKRGNNEGTVFKVKGKSLWAGQVTIQGKKVRKYHKTMKEARNWVQATLTQVDGGLTLSGAQATLADYLNEWLVVHSTSVRPKTADQYKQICIQHIIPDLGPIKMKDLQPRQIQALYSRKMQNGISARTVILIHAVIRRALNQAVKMGVIGRNPAMAVTRPKFHRKEMKTLSDSQVRTLLSIAQGNRFEAVFWVAVTTGLRLGELMGLKWSDLDWTNRRIRIQRQLQRLQGGLAFSEPKTAAGRRVIVLGSATIEKLRKHLELQSVERQFAGSSWKENDMMFPSTIGTPMDPSNLYHIFKDLLKLANLPDIRFHDLRHTAATLMLQQNVHPKIVQSRLGHSDISMTLNTYSHVLPSMQDEAAEKLDELLTPINISSEIKKLSERTPSFPLPISTDH